MILELPCGHAYDTEQEVTSGKHTRGKHHQGERMHECTGLNNDLGPVRFIIKAEESRNISYSVKQIIHPEAL